MSPISILAGGTVTVKIIDCATLANVPTAAMFRSPPIEGHNYLTAPSFSFLIEHASFRQTVLFDLSIRKDWHNLGPELVTRLEQVGYQVNVKENVADVLSKEGLRGEDVNAVIWSHPHWDHKGDMSTFPSTTDLVVSPEFKERLLKPGGDNPGHVIGAIIESDYVGRTVREIDFKHPGVLQIGQFRAFDYFGDGSLYLLDAPGHCIAHDASLRRDDVPFFPEPINNWKERGLRNDLKWAFLGDFKAALTASNDL